MADDVEPTGARRELPILRAALARMDAGEELVRLRPIQADVGLDAAQMRIGLRALETANPPYVSV